MKDTKIMLNKSLSRRDMVKKTLGTGGALAVGSALPGIDLLSSSAEAQIRGQSGAVVVIYLNGGYNALFSSANSFSGNSAFGVNANNMLDLGNDLVVDSVFAQLSPFAKEHMATVGVAHGISAHTGAQTAQFTFDAKNPLMLLADAIGGSGSIKCANVGPTLIPGPRTAVGSTSLQQINDMQATIDALGGGKPDPTMPKREFAAMGINIAHGMSDERLIRNPKSLQTVADGYKSAIETLNQPMQPLNAAEFMTAYGLTNTVVNSFAAQMAAAELMIKSGTNVVAAVDGTVITWDTHGDASGARARQLFATRIMPGLKTFLDRNLVAGGRNVTVVILGDFARSLPQSDHAPVTVATAIGTNVKVGTTGKVTPTVGLSPGTPSIPGMWGYISALAKAESAVTQFGGNPHVSIIGV